MVVKKVTLTNRKIFQFIFYLKHGGIWESKDRLHVHELKTKIRKEIIIKIRI